MEVYKKTLNLSQAIQKGQELADIQKRKEEAERLKKEQEVVQTSVAADQPAPAETTAVVEEEPQRDWIGFRAYLSREDAVKFDVNDGFHAATITGSSAISQYLPDFNQPGAVKDGEVEMVAATVLKNTKHAGVLRNVKIA